MKNTIFFLTFLFAFNAFALGTLDINVIHERSSFEIKETICGWSPDPEKGFMPDGNGCFYTAYEMKAPLKGFSIVPRTGDVPQAARAAYYIQFLGPDLPAQENLHAEVTSGGKPVRSIDSVYHDNTLQGIAALETGEALRLYSDAEPSYMYIYVITVIIIILGMTFIVRRKDK
ncbi:hypothetical protein [Seleniivibrio sp.]|uniref:hypothetical protein n=1 Tax=Seleniivibrio sp. TaxID=2898801 RepID=UPI0025DC799E|nr:hypothetical protein [Seleniivibrio sp.]MCD8553183.1 hypothetical protein [Seleniivibrio sp.]